MHNYGTYNIMHKQTRACTRTRTHMFMHVDTSICVASDLRLDLVFCELLNEPYTSGYIFGWIYGFMQHALFADGIEGDGLKALRRVLVSAACYHPDIGYTQSLNFVGGLLLVVSMCGCVLGPAVVECVN